MHPRNHGEFSIGEIATIAFLIMFFSYLFIKPIPTGLSEGTGDYPVPNNRDWVIENDTHVHDESINLKGSLLIMENATLTLENVTLDIHSNNNDIRGIYVYKGGELIVNYSEISSHPSSFIFLVEGNLSMESCDVSDTTTGIQNEKGYMYIGNSSIYNNDLAGVLCNGTSVLINNNIQSWTWGVVISFFHYAYLENNTITSCEWGINVIAYAYAYLLGNIISNNSLGGLNLELGNFEIHNNTIASNGGYGIQCDHAIINASNNLIYDNERWGIYSRGTPIFQENNYFEKDGKYNGEGDVVLEWEVLIQVFDENNNSVDNVDIEILNTHGHLIWNGTTIGNARTKVLREYQITDNGTLLNHTPYTIIAKKGTITGSATLDASQFVPSIFESATVIIILDTGDEEKTIIDTSPSEWVALFISIIWIIALLFFVIGLGISFRKRRK